MTIQEQLTKLNGKFEALHKDFILLEQEKKNLDAAFVCEKKKIQEKWQKIINTFQEDKEDALKYYRIAKDNSNNELTRYGVVPAVPDLARLNNLIENIDVNDRNDAVAGRIIDLVSSYVCYLEQEIAKSDSKRNADLLQLKAKFEGKFNLLIGKKKQIFAQCEQYLRGTEMKNLVKLFELIHQGYEIDQVNLASWNGNHKRIKTMLFGYSQYPVDVPKIMVPVIKETLKHHFDENSRTVHCPCGYNVEGSSRFFVEYTEKNKEQLKAGIQAMILNYLRYFPSNEYKVSIFDYIHYNMELLGPVSVFGGIDKGMIESVPSNSSKVKQYLQSLADYYHKMEKKLGVQNVYEYNKTCSSAEKIPYRILIINRQQEVFRSFEEAELSYLLNNASRFGIVVIHLTKSMDGGSWGTKKEKQYVVSNAHSVHMISDAEGRFYLKNERGWIPFSWLSSVKTLPAEFVNRVMTVMKPKEIGTRYFDRYKKHLPERSVGKRKPIVIPFAVDDHDHPVTCTFENELFAAYMMGASRSGKSTLLHTIISGIVMNYHPDEVELWLMDFKMLEFKKYANHRPPHVKYLLLEKSADLVFDMIDQMTAVLEKREYIFSKYGWDKLTQVPPEIHMPAIFVIIDEFAQMSQILKSTSGMGYGADYTIKLENLLSKGAALGFKFIFSSQTYTTGVSGLTDTARKQIQLRFALKNTPDEIKQTLSLSSSNYTSEIERYVSSMQPYTTLFKCRDEDGHTSVGRFRNMYADGKQVDDLLDWIRSSMKETDKKEDRSPITYYKKSPVFIDGSEPKTFFSQIPVYKAYEADLDMDELDDEDVLMYPGVSCSFQQAKPFILSNATAHNILMAGGDRESRMSVLLSLMLSYGRRGYDIEIWGHERDSTYRKYKKNVLGKRKMTSDLEEICGKIRVMKEKISARKYTNKMIIVLGYEQLANDLEILGADAENNMKRKVVSAEKAGSSIQEKKLDLMGIMKISDPEEKKKMILEYNRQLAEEKEKQTSVQEKQSEEKEEAYIYDAREDMKWLIRRGPNYGVHFVFGFEQARDLNNLKIDPGMFKHKLVFAMSRDDSSFVLGSKKANEIEDGICLYSNGKEFSTMHPHLHQGVMLKGWQIDEHGNAVQKGSL